MSNNTTAIKPTASVEETVLRIIGDHLGIPPTSVPPDAHLSRDLGGDSLDHMELIMTVEDRFGISLPEKEIQTVERVDQLIAAVKRRCPVDNVRHRYPTKKA